LVPKLLIGLLETALNDAQLDANRRAETLSLSEFARLSDVLRPLVPNFTS
jgi:16S rRNA A1518/A1519 N6-dimethyltransferase RsmA/KsgA/DIM1 with predicted DNA glycosylase/AP lyase activity